MSEPAKIKDIETPFVWAIEGVIRPVPFFEHLPALLPKDCVLCVEGIAIAPEMAAFYSAHHAANAVEVRRDTIYPEPQTYHVAFSEDVCAAMRQFAESHAISEMFDHIKVYRGGELLLHFQDAFKDILQISDHVPAETVAQFCQALGVSSRHEKTKKLEVEQLRKVALAFERLERSRAPWFKRAWYWITGA